MPCRLTKNQSPRTRAHFEDCDPCERLERAKGLEPSTPTLARSCSTTELHPHPKALAAIEARAPAADLCQMLAANATGGRRSGTLKIRRKSGPKPPNRPLSVD